MSYNTLIDTAKKIPAAGAKAVAEYKKKSDLLIESINHYMVSRPDITILIGKNNLSKMKSNHTNQVLFVQSVLNDPNPRELADTLLWVFNTYRRQGFKTSYWNVQLDAWFEIFKDHLSAETYAEIIPLYEWIRKNIPVLSQLTAASEKETEFSTDRDILSVS